ITNNVTEAAGQSVMFGGQDPAISGVIPTDIEVRGNYMTKRLAWREFDPSFAGTLVTVKEVFELKNARRVLIDGNIFEHSWKSSDHDGHAIQFTPRDQTGGAPWSLVEDVTFTHNIVRQATNGFFTLGTDYTFPSGPLQRVLIQNNLIYGIGSFPENGSAFWFGALLIMRDGVTAVTFDHNTAFQSGDVLHASAVNHTPNTGLVFTNNVGDGNVSSEAAAGPAAALATSFPGAVFTRNVLLNGNTSAYPAGNWFPPGMTPIVNAFYGGDDYHLVPGSPYHNAAIDGRDVGADIDAILAATANVISGTSSPTPPAPPPPPPPAPTVLVTPSTQDFGSVAVGGSADRSFTVRNSGGSSVSGTAAGSGPFNVLSGSPFVLGPGGSQTVVAQLKPTTTGAYVTNVSFT